MLRPSRIAILAFLRVFDREPGAQAAQPSRLTACAAREAQAEDATPQRRSSFGMLGAAAGGASGGVPVTAIVAPAGAAAPEARRGFSDGTGPEVVYQAL